ncbi:MAG: hypothetical protein ABI284_06530 [Nitrosospira sp.]
MKCLLRNDEIVTGRRADSVFGSNLVYRLVKMHGDMIDAISEGEDKGSEFIV